MTHHEFTAVEMMTCSAARLFEDDKAYLIGFGMPQIAAVLANSYTPHYTPHISSGYTSTAPSLRNSRSLLSRLSLGIRKVTTGRCPGRT